MGQLFLWLALMLISHDDGIQQRQNFSWLSGTWELKNKNGSSRLEVWHHKDENTLKGSGLKVTGKDTVLLESIELVYKDETYWYIPTVPDQNEAKPVPFKLTCCEKFQASFENSGHDFPQRIIYRMKPTHPEPFKAMSGDSLFVRVETLSGEGIDFSFLRH